jgi:hypothetical protein
MRVACSAGEIGCAFVVRELRPAGDEVAATLRSPATSAAPAAAVPRNERRVRLFITLV